MKSTKREEERRFSFLGLGLALVFFALPAVALADSGGWLLNEEDGSEGQVNEMLAGADEMLQPLCCAKTASSAAGHARS